MTFMPSTSSMLPILRLSGLVLSYARTWTGSTAVGFCAANDTERIVNHWHDTRGYHLSYEKECCHCKCNSRIRSLVIRRTGAQRR